MPHPERVFLSKQFSWLSPAWQSMESPWFALFANARRFVA
jgi:phosphoribosylformylglycinamidine synthase